MSGHSHQAWPDVSRQAVVDAWDDAAQFVDGKWERVEQVSAVLREHISGYFGVPADAVALAQNSHELVSRFLSALPLRERPKIVTTSGEFHSMKRQLLRLREEGVEVVFVDPLPRTGFATRMIDAIDDATAAVMLSTVFFESSRKASGLASIAKAANLAGAEVLFDVYHHFPIAQFPPIDSPFFATGGGYKYAQWGEGNCFLVVPISSKLRPVYTGWFSDFSSLEEGGKNVRYGKNGASRFAGSTFDPTSRYRAKSVIGFFEKMGWTTRVLEDIYRQQTSALADQLDGLSLLAEEEERVGFVAIETHEHSRAAKTHEALLEKGILADFRGSVLRLGPAPYTTDEEIEYTTKAVREALT